MVLVNGSDGIGTGWSSTVSNYNPREIIANLRRKIHGEDVVKMHPYYAGFVGDIIPHQDGSNLKYVNQGKIERVNDTTILISELPLMKWTQDYKVFLEGMITGVENKKGGRSEPEITDFKENHTETTVSFTITAAKEKIDQFEKEKNGLLGKFKLSGNIR